MNLAPSPRPGAKSLKMMLRHPEFFGNEAGNWETQFFCKRSLNGFLAVGRAFQNYRNHETSLHFAIGAVVAASSRVLHGDQPLKMGQR